MGKRAPLQEERHSSQSSTTRQSTLTESSTLRLTPSGCKRSPSSTPTSMRCTPARAARLSSSSTVQARFSTHSPPTPSTSEPLSSHSPPTPEDSEDGIQDKESRLWSAHSPAKAPKSAHPRSLFLSFHN